MHNIKRSTIYKIAINCCGLIGDALIRVPFIEKVAELFPQAKITVIVDPGREELFRNHPKIDRVYSYNRSKKPRLHFLKNFLNYVFFLRRQRFDILFDLYSGGSSSGITQVSKARYRFGFYYNEKAKKAYTHAWPYPERAEHWGQDFGLLLAPFGVNPKDLRAGTSFYPDDINTKKCNAIFSDPSEPWVIFNMGAGRVRKTWSVDKFLQLAEKIDQTEKVHFGVIVNPDQAYLANEFQQGAKKQGLTNVNLLRSDSFSELAYFLKKARLFVTGDTGLLHLAFGVKADTVAIFTYTRPEHVLPEDCRCIACFTPSVSLKDQNGRALGTNDISVETVYEACKKLLNNNNAASTSDAAAPH